MKKYLIIFAIYFSGSSLRAQLSKNSFFIGGTINTMLNSSVNTGNASTTTNDNFSIQPSVGFLISSRVAIGLSVGYSHNSVKFQYYLDPVNPNGKSQSNLYSITPFFRYYIPVSETVFFSLHSQFSIGRGNASVGNTFIIPGSGVFVNTNTNWSAVSISSQPVIIFFPSNHWGIEAGLSSIGYYYSVYKPVDPSITNTTTIKSFAFNAGTISIGVSYYFGKSNILR